MNENIDFHHLGEIINNIKATQEIEQILEAMLEYPTQINQKIWILSEPPQELTYSILKELKKQQLVTFQDNRYVLTKRGLQLAKNLKNNNKTSKRDTQRQEKLKKSHEFVELYKQGLSYQQIAEKHGISRERVRQILSVNSEFEAKKTQKHPSLIEAYPDFVQQYWDYEKNQALNLEPNILTCQSGKKVYFRCSHDGNEWQAQISSTVNRQWSQGNAGCCVCNGTEHRRKSHEFVELYKQGLSYQQIAEKHGISRERVRQILSVNPEFEAKKTQKQPSLIEVYPDFVQQYWDYEKNQALNNRTLAN